MTIDKISTIYWLLRGTFILMNEWSEFVVGLFDLDLNE